MTKYHIICRDDTWGFILHTTKNSLKKAQKYVDNKNTDYINLGGRGLKYFIGENYYRKKVSTQGYTSPIFHEQKSWNPHYYANFGGGASGRG